MPSTMTYTSLVSDVLAYLERTDSAVQTQVPRFVMLAENRLASELKNLGETIPTTGTFTVQGATIPKPAYWRNTISLHATIAGQRTIMLPRLYEYCRLYWPDTTKYAAPRFYSDYDYNNILLTPTPDQAYAFEMVYFARVRPLDDTNGTNWFTINAPQLLFYAVLLEANMFLKNWDQVAAWQPLYDRALQAIIHEQAMTLTDRSVSATNNA